MKTRDKFKHCQYNANRLAWQVAKPYCVWNVKEVIVMPPHVFWDAKPMEDKTCVKCKCFVNADD